LSEYRNHSDTAKINRTGSNEEVFVKKETIQLILRCKEISSLTNGSFDITMGKLKKLYNFNNQNNPFPSQIAINEALKTVGYDKIIINTKNSSINKLESNTNISFNAIGKGYAADCVKKIWLENGINSGFINASGDLCTFGVKADGNPWKIAIANPDHKNAPLFSFSITNQAIATSGDYEQHFMYKGKRYSHNINPKTGKPLMGIKSVSVISPSAELSDALATAVYVMGSKKGIDFINQLPQTHAIIIDEKNKVYLSNKLKYEVYNSI
jgi:thiamine biosynthesis lipoprotein